MVFDVSLFVDCSIVSDVSLRFSCVFMLLFFVFLCFLSAQIDQILVAKIGLAKVGRDPLGPCTKETLFARFGVCQCSTAKWGFGF